MDISARYFSIFIGKRMRNIGVETDYFDLWIGNALHILITQSTIGAVTSPRLIISVKSRKPKTGYRAWQIGFSRPPIVKNFS